MSYLFLFCFGVVSGGAIFSTYFLLAGYRLCKNTYKQDRETVR